MSQLYEAQNALDRAEDTLEESAYNLTGGYTIATVNRAYYSIFYCITALLHTEDTHTKRHSGAHGRFHDLFVRTERFPHETVKWIHTVFQLRQSGDYDLDADISEEQAVQSLQYARQFYDLTKVYIDNLLKR